MAGYSTYHWAVSVTACPVDTQTSSSFFILLLNNSCAYLSSGGVGKENWVAGRML